MTARFAAPTGWTEADVRSVRLLDQPSHAALRSVHRGQDSGGRRGLFRARRVRVADGYGCTVTLPCARHAAAQRVWPGIGDSL